MPKKGQTFCFSEGSYSDYRLTGHFIALKDFNMNEEGKKAAASMGTHMVKQYSKYDTTTRKLIKYDPPIEVEKPKPLRIDHFQAHLIREGLAQEADVNEYYFGDYDFEGFGGEY